MVSNLYGCDKTLNYIDVGSGWRRQDGWIAKGTPQEEIIKIKKKSYMTQFFEKKIA
jgi:uncharacterized membrane protein